MQDDRLKKLIQEADAQPHAAGGNPVDLAARVRSVHERRRRRRLAITMVAVVLSGGLLWRFAPFGRLPKQRQAAPEVAIMPTAVRVPSQAALPATTEQIDREEQIVQRLLVAERARRLAQEAEELSARMTLPASRDEQVGPLAASYLVSGDYKREIGLSAESAREDYARVIELFPETIWADQAKARLASFKP